MTPRRRAGADEGSGAGGAGPGELARRLKERAREEGFDRAGIAAPDPSGHLGVYRRWLRSGAHGEMAYLARPDAVRRRGDLRRTLPSVRSVLVAAHGYFVPDGEGVPDDPARGVVARYARGRDYHRVVLGKLRTLHRWLEEETGRRVEARAYVDTGPILERELGVRAGLGWFGKNTMLIDPQRGSYFFLGLLLLDLPLPPDPPFAGERCGSCRRCLEACPTGALRGYGPDGEPLMDACLCISYLTIEHRGPIPRELRPRIGNRIFGCDICQEVCPWNVRFARPTGEEAYRPRPGLDGPALLELAALGEEEFRERFRGSPVRRAGRRGLLRNVMVALGNWGAAEAVPALIRGLGDPEPLVRGHAAWALGRIAGAGAVAPGVARRARRALASRLEEEGHGAVREEIGAALGEGRGPRGEGATGSGGPPPARPGPPPFPSRRRGR